MRNQREDSMPSHKLATKQERFKGEIKDATLRVRIRITISLA